MSEKPAIAQLRALIIDAARFDIAFDGFSDKTLRTAGAAAGASSDDIRLAFPRGAVDLAYHFHLAGDDALAEAMAEMPGDLRYSKKVAWAVRKRLEIAAPDREAVRRAAAFFALPFHAPTGARALWHTADTIWTGLGDTSEDVNWYSKRVILSGVYSSAVLFWLGDTSDGFEKTWAFVDRRIADVMQFEKAKASARKSPFYKAFKAGPGRLLEQIRAPKAALRDDLPGAWKV